MTRAIFVTVFALALSAGVFAQSGRRIAPKPSPSPTAKSDDPAGYSESKPRSGNQ